MVSTLCDPRAHARIPVERQALSVEEAAHILGIGRTSAYRACAREEIPTIRIGARILVPRAALERLLSPQAGESAGS